jgi:hypothetical protein
VYVVPWFNAISDPMIIGPAFKTQDALMDTLTHELLHRLLTDNDRRDPTHDFLKDWEKLFGKHPFNVLVHIPVHAVMNKIYVDVLQRPELVDYDIKSLSDSPDYLAAWDYVKDVGYEKIILKLAKQYKA